MKPYFFRLLMIAGLLLAACKNQQPVKETDPPAIDVEMFEHHYISRDLPAMPTGATGGR